MQKQATAPSADNKETNVKLELFKAVVTAVNGGGYDVGLLSDNGDYAAHYSRCFCWPSSATYAVDDQVWLHFSEQDDAPVIFSGGGGGGSTCSVSVNTFGVKLG